MNLITTTMTKCVCSGTRTVGAQSVCVLSTLPLKSTCSELQFTVSLVEVSSVEISSCAMNKTFKLVLIRL